MGRVEWDLGSRGYQRVCSGWVKISVGQVGSRKPGILAGMVVLGQDFRGSGQVQEAGDISGYGSGWVKISVGRVRSRKPGILAGMGRVGSLFPWVRSGPGSRGY